MLKKLSALFESEYTVDKLKARYAIDYVDNKPLWDSLPEHVRLNLLGELHYRREQFDLDHDPRHIFNSIQLIHAVTWLNKTGYGEKLRSKLLRLIYKDDYGDDVIDGAEKELNHFVKTRLDSIIIAVDESIDNYYINCAKKLDCADLPCIELIGLEGTTFINALELVRKSKDLFVNYLSDNSHSEFDTEDPYEYEKIIAEKLCLLGWSAQATSGSGDQGADVIAEKENIKLVVQCKLYSQPVGNKAVQEVASAERFFGASYSAVVTNNEFTKSARQLADSLGIYLVHHSRLQEMSDLILGQQEAKTITIEAPTNLASILSDELESLGWETSYDDDDPIDEYGNFDQILMAQKQGISIIINCTDFLDSPIDIEHLEINKDAFEHSNSFDLLVVTSSSGFTDEAIDYASANSIILLDNINISALGEHLNESLKNE